MKLCAIPTSVREEEACDTRWGSGWWGEEQSRGHLCPGPLQAGVTGHEVPRMSNFQIWLCIFFQKKMLALLSQSFTKRWQEYTELYKKDPHDPVNYDDVIIHLEPDILECEVKWALGNITTNKASGGDGIPAELFQILKDDAVKVLHSMCQQIWKTQQWPQDWKRSAFIPVPKKGNAKECSNYHTIALISHLFQQSNAENSPS